MIFLKLTNWVNHKWNNIIFWIHDVTTRMGIGHTSVWLFDNLTWTLPQKWQLIAGKTHEQYMLEHELYIAQHQVQYYANLAYDYQWVILDAMVDDKTDSDDSADLVYEADHWESKNKEIKKNE